MPTRAQPAAAGYVDLNITKLYKAKHCYSDAYLACKIENENQLVCLTNYFYENVVSYTVSTDNWLSKTCSFTDKTISHNKHAQGIVISYNEVTQNKNIAE